MPVALPNCRPCHRLRGFTLMEVLMVIAVIGILLSILIPALGGAQNSAKRAKTRVQFSQWSAAIEQFRQEYGFYPNFTQFEDGKIFEAYDTQQFVQTLSGRQLDGTAMTIATEEPDGLGLAAGNTKRIMFCTFGSGDFSAADRIQDAFGNIEIVVVMDRNLDGSIDTNVGGTDYSSSAPPTSISSIGGQSVNVAFPSGGLIRAGVAFYSAGDGQTPVTSW